MNVDLIIAMIARREQAAKDRANRLARDPMLKSAELQHRAVYNAMHALRREIIDNLESATGT